MLPGAEDIAADEAADDGMAADDGAAALEAAELAALDEAAVVEDELHAASVSAAATVAPATIDLLLVNIGDGSSLRDLHDEGCTARSVARKAGNKCSATPRRWPSTCP